MPSWQPPVGPPTCQPCKTPGNLPDKPTVDDVEQRLEYQSSLLNPCIQSLGMSIVDRITIQQSVIDSATKQLHKEVKRRLKAQAKIISAISDTLMLFAHSRVASDHAEIERIKNELLLGGMQYDSQGRPSSNELENASSNSGTMQEQDGAESQTPAPPEPEWKTGLGRGTVEGSGSASGGASQSNCCCCAAIASWPGWPELIKSAAETGLIPPKVWEIISRNSSGRLKPDWDSKWRARLAKPWDDLLAMIQQIVFPNVFIRIPDLPDLHGIIPARPEDKPGMSSVPDTDTGVNPDEE